MFLGLSWYFILMDFYLYSFFGWIYECSFCSLKEHKVINRGFLVGPLLPLYGFGGTIVHASRHGDRVFYLMGYGEAVPRTVVGLQPGPLQL